MNTLENKIDKIAQDVSYMKGQFDTAIPQMQKVISNNDERLRIQEKKTENIAGKVGIIGAITGAVGSALIALFIHK